jgi:hypothetical protein
MLQEVIELDHVFRFHSIINRIPKIGHKGDRKVLEGLATAFPYNHVTVGPAVISEGNFIVKR